MCYKKNGRFIQRPFFCYTIGLELNGNASHKIAARHWVVIVFGDSLSAVDIAKAVAIGFVHAVKQVV